MWSFKYFEIVRSRCFIYYLRFIKRNEPLFDKCFYLENNSDVLKSGINPVKHYLKFGGFEGRMPSSGFDSQYYLDKYKDVSISGMNPLLHYLLYGKKEGRFTQKKDEEESNLLKNKSYHNWIAEYDTLSDNELKTMMKSIGDFVHKPLISIIMPVYNSNSAWLTEAIESVINQIYPYWELCIADDCSTDPEVIKILENYKETNSQIKVVFRNSNGHIPAASNSAIELAEGEFIALLDHDDLLPTHALFWVVKAINQNPNVKLLYSDEDKINCEFKRSEPYFKCNWNPELFYSQNFISHLGVYNTEIVKKIGGFRSGFEGSQDYDLALRFTEIIDKEDIFHIPKVLYHWRIHENSTSSVQNIKQYAFTSGQKAIGEHFRRAEINADVQIMSPGLYRIKYALPDPLPLVTLIIPTKNKSELLSKCVSSILSKTTYPNYDILIIDNNSDEQETIEYLAKIQFDKKVKCIRDERPFNFSSICNNAVQLAEGEYIGLLNNDTEVITPEWIEEMLAIAAREGIGAVGAKLLYPDNTIQHGGIVLGIGGVASHAHKHQPGSSYGYFGRAVLTQEFSAVTAACCLIRKSTYLSIGGLDEKNLAIAFNDVDFCLRLKHAGYRNIWTPFAQLYHHESVSRGNEDTQEKEKRFNREKDFLINNWGDLFENDPAYNPNLTLQNENFELAWPPRNILRQ